MRGDCNGQNPLFLVQGLSKPADAPGSQEKMLGRKPGSGMLSKGGRWLHSHTLIFDLLPLKNFE